AGGVGRDQEIADGRSGPEDHGLGSRGHRASEEPLGVDAGRVKRPGETVAYRLNRGIHRGVALRYASYSSPYASPRVGSSYSRTKMSKAATMRTPYRTTPKLSNRTAWPKITAATAMYIGLRTKREKPTTLKETVGA